MLDGLEDAVKALTAVYVLSPQTPMLSMETTRKAISAFRKVAGDSIPIYVQQALSWAPSADDAFYQALDQ